MLCLAFIPRGKTRYHISVNHRRYLCVYCVLLLDLRPINPLAYAFGYPCSTTAQSHIYIFHPLPPSFHSSVCHCIYIYGSRLMHDSKYTTFALLSVCLSAIYLSACLPLFLCVCGSVHLSQSTEDPIIQQNSSSFFLSFSSFVCLFLHLLISHPYVSLSCKTYLNNVFIVLWYSRVVEKQIYHWLRRGLNYACNDYERWHVTRVKRLMVLKSIILAPTYLLLSQSLPLWC